MTLGIGFGGVRYQVHALLDGRRFDSFHIDVGSGDPLIEPVEYLTTPNLLFFADLEPTRVPCYPIPQQLAEKLHAYTRPRKTGESSRVKDFVDILLLAEYGEISGQGLIRSIEVTFHRAGTHAVPANMLPPPKNWSPVFRRLADEVGMRDRTLDQAFSAIQQFLDPILSGKASGMWWNLVTWSWIKK